MRSVRSLWLAPSQDCQGLENAQPHSGVTQQGQGCLWELSVTAQGWKSQNATSRRKTELLEWRVMWCAKPVASLHPPSDEEISQEGAESSSITQCCRQSLVLSQLLLLQGVSRTLHTGGRRGVNLHWCAAVCQGLHYSSQGLVLSKNNVPDLL